MGLIKRFFYAPGLISLIGIFILLPHFYKKNAPAKPGVLPLFLPLDCHNDSEMPNKFSACNLEREVKHKRQATVTLNENKKENKKKLDVVRYEALKLKYFKDTSTVIIINLSDSISYGDFVAIVDMCEYDGHKKYASWNNRFVIFGEPPPKKKDTSNSLQSWGNDLVIVPKPVIKPTLFELLKTKINKYYTPKGMCLLLAWIAVLISFLYFRKRNSVLQKH